MDFCSLSWIHPFLYLGSVISAKRWHTPSYTSSLFVSVALSSHTNLVERLSSRELSDLFISSAACPLSPPTLSVWIMTSLDWFLRPPSSCLPECKYGNVINRSDFYQDTLLWRPKAKQAAPHLHRPQLFTTRTLSPARTHGHTNIACIHTLTTSHK